MKKETRKVRDVPLLSSPLLHYNDESELTFTLCMGGKAQNERGADTQSKTREAHGG